MITRENVTDADTTRAFGPEVLPCPDCGHGIDPHGVDPGGPCGVGDEDANPCPCLLQPNGIACLLIEELVREARMYNPRPADVREARRQWRSLTEAAVSAESIYNAMIEQAAANA